MKPNRREFIKMMAAGMAGAILPIGTVNAKQKAGPLDDRAAAYNTGRNGGFLSVDEIREKENTNETGLRVSKGENPKIAGYVIRFGSFMMAGSPPNCFMEKIEAGAFDKLLANKDLNVSCLKNFDPNLVLGRMKDGTLRLSADAVGLKFEIDLPDTNIGRETREEIRRGDISFDNISFTVAEDDWRFCDDDVYKRVVTRIEQIGNISLNVKEIQHNDFEGIIR